jgi:hypothetical protein
MRKSSSVGTLIFRTHPNPKDFVNHRSAVIFYDVDDEPVGKLKPRKGNAGAWGDSPRGSGLTGRLKNKDSSEE